jgi:hypothetical protein
VLGALALVLVVGPACAWRDGGPFGEVTVELTTRWTDVPARGGAWQKLASDYEVLVTSASATFGALSLVDVGTAALNFDPADPPPGYSNCHSGHCHADDGRLVPYEEIAAEIAGGGGPAAVLALAVGSRELRTGGSAVLPCDAGVCALPLATIGRVELPIVRLELAGQVRDTRTPPRVAGEVAWTIALDRAEDAAPAIGALALPVDRGHAPRIALTVRALPSVALLDGVAFDQDPLPITTIHQEIDEFALDTTFSREDP